MIKIIILGEEIALYEIGLSARQEEILLNLSGFSHLKKSMSDVSANYLLFLLFQYPLPYHLL